MTPDVVRRYQDMRGQDLQTTDVKLRTFLGVLMNSEERCGSMVGDTVHGENSPHSGTVP